MKIIDNYFFKKRVKIVERLIPQNFRDGRILDIGCGDLPQFLINTEFKEKYGIDKITFENSGLDNDIYLAKFDIEKNNLPYENNFFDVITMLAVFEHIEMNKLPSILKEIRRMLKPDGRFILTTPSPHGNMLLEIMAKLGLISKESINEHKSISYLSEIKRLLGFEFKKIESGHFEFGLNSWVMGVK